MTSMTPQELTPDHRQDVVLDKGDICVAATWSDAPPDIRRNSGHGRVLVYDKNLVLKGALWTGETGLVIGVEYNEIEQALYASDMISRTVKRFSITGSLLPSHPQQQGKPFSTMAFRKDGSLVIGEHVHGERPPFVGDGDIYTYDQQGYESGRFKVAHDKGKFGFHAVTNLTLSADGAVVYYVSETGKRVMCYDLKQARQLPDVFAFGEDEDKFTAGIDRTREDQLLVSHVYGASLYDLSGCLLKTYNDIPHERGWAAVHACHDGESFLVGNFFTGRIEKRSLQSGELLGEIETGLVYKLSEICEIL